MNKVKPDARPSWMQNADAFEAIAAQTMAAVSPAPEAVAVVPAKAGVALLLRDTGDASQERVVGIQDGVRNYALHESASETARVIVGALTIAGADAQTISVRMPAVLLLRLDARVRGNRAAGTTALLLYALNRLTQANENLVYDDGAVRTEEGRGRIDSGAARIPELGSRKLAQSYPGALVSLIDSRRDGPWPATLVALLMYALDEIEARPCELRLRVA